MLSTANVHTNSDSQAFWTAFVLPRIATTGSVSPRDKAGAVHARRVLNDELSAMHFAMCALRTRCNALAPISALPAEVLVHIFHLYAAVQPPGWQNLRPLGWIEVTHVCRLWRDTAVQFPSLWSDISFTLGQRWTKEILRRTKSVPISVYRDVTDATQRSLRLISHHLPHTRDLTLVGPSFDIKTLIDTLPSPDKILETIELGPVNLNIQEFPDNSYELPGAIAGCRLPSLRRLVLRTFWVPWSAPILHGLRCLEVELHRPHSAAERYSGSSEELFSALKNMPNLETLSLIECLPRGPWNNDSSDILELPRLKVLRLQGPSAHCFSIANRLRIPAFCRVQISCSYRSEAADAAGIIPFLTAHVRSDNPDLPPWHTLSVSAHWDSSSHLQLWRHSDKLEEEGRVFNPILDADFEIYFYSLGLDQSIHPLKILCQALPLHTIKTLTAWTMMNTTPQDWIDIVSGCTNVEAASFNGAHGTSFCTALGTMVDGKAISMSQDCGQGQLFLGNLKLLHLSDVEFSSWVSEETNDIPYSLLTGWLTDRHRVEGVPAIDIILQDCDIPEVWVKCLKLVAIVSWDGYEGEYRSNTEQSEDCSDADEQ